MTGPAHVASTRMYNVAPGATAAWRRLLARVSRQAGVPLTVVDHPHPATLAELWGRPDLACAFMCGWPLAQEGGTRPVVAVPAQPYHSVFVVAAGSLFRSVEDTFGGRFAFNSRGSHSGWTMPAAHLAGLGGWYSSTVGPFGPHQLAAAAVARGEADVAAIDSLVWALLRRHDPALAGQLRAVGRTGDQPSPPLVGGPALPTHVQARLSGALLGLSGDADGQALLDDVCLPGFRMASLAEYAATRALEAEAARFRVPTA